MIFAAMCNRLGLFLILMLVTATSGKLQAQRLSATSESGNAFASVFIPLDSSMKPVPSNLVLFDQLVKVDLYDGYAAVSATYWFNNSSGRPLTMAVGFPAEVQGVHHGTKYWLRYYINNHAPEAAFDTSAGTNWKWWQVDFIPGITEVKVQYGLSIADEAAQEGDSNQNCFQYHFLNDKLWNSTGKGRLWIQMNDGFTTTDIDEVVPAESFQAGNVLVHAFASSFSNDSVSTALLCYRIRNEERVNPNRVSWQSKFSRLALWHPDDKTLMTLMQFQTMRKEEEKKRAEAMKQQALNRWKWIIGTAISVLGIALLVWSELRARRRQRSRNGGSTRE